MDSAVDRQSISARLKAARSRVYPSAADAARALGMKPVTVRAHESGQNGVDYIDLERYARRYGVDITWLLTGQGSDRPSASYYLEHGERLRIGGYIQDGAWLDADPDRIDYPLLRMRAPTPDGEEFVTYSDPRFPTEMVEAYKVTTKKIDGPYVDGAVIFCVPYEAIGYKNGDHVLIVLEDRVRNLAQWTLRRARHTEKGIMYDPILSDSPSLPYSDSVADGVLTDVRGVVIGSVQRRQVNELSLKERQHRARLIEEVD